MNARRRLRRAEEEEEDDEDEGGGNLLAKVLMFVFGGILLIAALAGGLWWYVASDKAGKAAAEQQQVAAGFDKAKKAVAETVERAEKFADEFDEFAMKAIEACKGPTKELSGLVDAEFAAMLDPGPTQELLDAIAATNEPVAVEAAAPAATNAVADAAAATNAVAAAGATTNAAPAEAAAPAPAPEAAPAEAPKEPKQMPEAVISMREIWDRAYGCQACAVRIRHAVRQLVRKAAEADDVKVVNEANAQALGRLSQTLVEMFEQIKSSKDVETVKKGISYVKSRSDKVVKQTQKRLLIEKREKERAEAKAAAEAAAKEREEKLAAEKAAKVEAETKTMTDKFELLVAQGTLRQMDWKTALRVLETAKAELETAEGQHAADLQIRKVNDMKKMQDLFIKNLPGHVFHGKLKGAKVTGANEKEISLDCKPTRIAWFAFYRKYPGNLNEIMNRFVVKGRENAKLNLKEWADVMTGAALTLQLVCAEVNGAVEKGEKLAKQTVAEFPSYEKTAKEIFPAITFGDAEKSEDGDGE